MILSSLADRSEKLSAQLQRLDETLLKHAAVLAAPAAKGIIHWHSDAAALRFQLQPSPHSPLTVIIGGTGTGKSTLVNRLVGHTVTAASFRRTFTSGPVAIVAASADLPADWLGVEHIQSTTEEPPRGQVGAVTIVIDPQTPTPLIDTPDLDGDQPANHAQADRAFRWAHRLVFVVTPEKYQMTELIPYYRLARRYELPAMFVMNKCEESAVVEDYSRQLVERDWIDAPLFVVPRDDAGYEPPAEKNLDALRDHLKTSPATVHPTGLQNRTADVIARLMDQVIAPLRESRNQADQLSKALHAMETPPAGVDVNPITDELRRRLQQRSVLYLLGPQRVLDRVRQVPTLLARLPRATWDWVMRGQMPADLNQPKSPGISTEPPDFQATLTDHFTVVRSRIDDVLRSNPLAAKWIADDPEGYQLAMIESPTAGLIAVDEIQQLRDWLEKRWNATPRDTRMLKALLKHLPGGERLTALSEAAPYLLIAALVVHHALFWHIDLPVLGGYSLLTWLTEKVSNEVNARTRSANRKIADRFEQLAHQQIQNVCEWMERQTLRERDLDLLEKMAGDLADD
jgi:hypothetical protein